MGDREGEKGKRKKLEYEEFVESSDGSDRRTRARTASSPDGQNVAGGNPSPPPLDRRDDGAQGGGEQGDSVGLQDPEVTRGFLAASSAPQHQLSGGVGNLGTSSIPSPRAGTSSSQMNFEVDYRMPENQLAANIVVGLRPQAPSSSQAQRPSFPGAHTPHYLPQGQGLSMRRAPSSGARRGDSAREGARGRGLQMQALAPATAGQPGAAAGASGSSQPQPPSNAGMFHQCPACHNNPRVGRCLLCGREPVNISIYPHQPPAPPPTRQGFPTAPTDFYGLVARPQTQVMIGQQCSWSTRVAAQAQRALAAPANCNALAARPPSQAMIGQQRSLYTRVAAPANCNALVGTHSSDAESVASPMPFGGNASEMQMSGSMSSGRLPAAATLETSSRQEGPNFKSARLSSEERRERVQRFLKKRNERKFFAKKITYACRKTLADSRPRVRGRFAKKDDYGEPSTAMQNQEVHEQMVSDGTPVAAERAAADASLQQLDDERQRCPGCCIREGSPERHPRPHLCLCAVCRESHVVCPICASGQAAATQG